MTAHSKEIIDLFCGLCDRLLQQWQLRKYLFDENSDAHYLLSPRHQHLFIQLSEILQESWLHSLAKLHDPATQRGGNGGNNLSIDYMIEHGNWDAVTKRELADLRDRMQVLAKPVKDARNKVLSHNDLVVLLSEKELGGFDAGEDELYFTNLKMLASKIREVGLGEPFVYDDLVKNDVDCFMQCFLRGVRA